MSTKREKMPIYSCLRYIMTCFDSEESTSDYQSWEREIERERDRQREIEQFWKSESDRELRCQPYLSDHAHQRFSERGIKKSYAKLCMEKGNIIEDKRGKTVHLYNDLKVVYCHTHKHIVTAFWTNNMSNEVNRATYARLLEMDA